MRQLFNQSELTYYFNENGSDHSIFENELFENNNYIENYSKNQINFFYFPQKHNFPCVNLIYDPFVFFLCSGHGVTQLILEQILLKSK